MVVERPPIDQQRFDQLYQAHVSLRKDFDALLRCLEESGTLSSASLHRERFGAALVQDPHAASRPPPTLADVLEPRALQALLRCCGGTELLALEEVCCAARGRFEDLLAGRLYAFGGTESLGGTALKTVECLDLRKGEWESMPAMKVGRSGHVAGAIGGHLYVCGGFGEFGRIVEKFDLRLQRWEPCPRPRRLAMHRAFAAAAVVDGRLYICGGEDMYARIVHSSVECFDPRMDCGKGGCELLPARMSAARRLHAAAAVPGQRERLLLVCGGQSLARSSDRAVFRAPYTSEALDVSHPNYTWERKASMTQPRCCHSAEVLRGSIYVCGGADADGNVTSMVERFDLECGCWIAMPPTLITRGFFCATALADRLFVVGGMENCRSGAPSVNSAECFNPDEGTWEWIPQMRQTRQAFAMVAVKHGGLVERSLD